MYYTLGDVHKWEDCRMAGYVDYCYADKMFRLEIIGMAEKMGLCVEGCRLWWLDLKSSAMGLREINMIEMLW